MVMGPDGIGPMTQNPSLRSPDGDIWYSDAREKPRIVAIEGGQLYRIDPVITATNGWYQVTQWRVADLLESRRLDLPVVHVTPELLISERGRFGFRTAYTMHFDGRVAEESLAANWRGPDGRLPEFGPLGELFDRAWAPFAGRALRALTTHPNQPTTPWFPRRVS